VEKGWERRIRGPFPLEGLVFGNQEKQGKDPLQCGGGTRSQGEGEGKILKSPQQSHQRGGVKKKERGLPQVKDSGSFECEASGEESRNKSLTQVGKADAEKTIKQSHLLRLPTRDCRGRGPRVGGKTDLKGKAEDQTDSNF